MAAHEFGHWHRILDQYAISRSDETTHGSTYRGETQKRSLDRHDIDSALIIYGRR